MKRINVIKSSKFETLTNEDMMNVVGGTTVCLACMKRSRKHPWTLNLPGPEIRAEEEIEEEFDCLEAEGWEDIS